ncbi:MAG: hypothetical protein ACTTJG_07320 [Treponema sp.]
MKHRVKTILFIGLALVALFGMTACQNNAGGTPKPKFAVTFSVNPMRPVPIIAAV